MRRAVAILVGACLVLGIGCGDYEVRLQKTYEEMKYQKRLKDNLADAPTKGLLQQDAIYVRPPKGLVGPTQTFSLTVVDPGKYDIENSFIDQEKKASLHLLVRIKKPKAAPDAKKAAPAAEITPRGKFIDDVVELVKAAYPVEQLTTAMLKPETKTHLNRENAYKAVKLDLADKEVQVYVYGDENSTHQVALIFEYPKTEVNNLSPKIGLCLESLAVGERARSAFSGGGDVEGGEEVGGGEPPPI
ncbi:MAG: hypothetical protein ACHRXM_37285 [Isosphaerales bacterium]